MPSHVDLDPIVIETRARALRAAYTRDFFRGLFARLRRAPQGAHA